MPDRVRRFLVRVLPALLPAFLLAGVLATVVPMGPHGMWSGRAAAAEPGTWEFEQGVRDAARRLRCVVCQGQSVWESNSAWAHARREEIRAMLGAGMTPDQVVEAFVAEWGVGILMQPPRRGPYWIAWIIPPAALLGAAALVAAWLGRARRGAHGPGKGGPGWVAAGAVPPSGEPVELQTGRVPGDRPTPSEQAELERRIWRLRGQI